MGKIESSVRKDSGEVKISLRELKDNYGKYQAIFVVSASELATSSHFLVINRQDAPG